MIHLHISAAGLPGNKKNPIPWERVYECATGIGDMESRVEALDKILAIERRNEEALYERILLFEQRHRGEISLYSLLARLILTYKFENRFHDQKHLTYC